MIMNNEETIDKHGFYKIEIRVLGTEEITEIKPTKKFQEFMTFLKWNGTQKKMSKEDFEKYYQEFMKTYKG